MLTLDAAQRALMIANQRFQHVRWLTNMDQNPARTQPTGNRPVQRNVGPRAAVTDVKE